mgnify:CR=1 FL=1|jgi:DNA-directed RNA polymerase subunit RPC12/RpoP
MFYKCDKCEQVFLTYRDETIKTKSYWTNGVFCPICGNDHTQKLPLWVIQQEVEYYLKQKNNNKNPDPMNSMLYDMEYVTKLLEIAELAETLKKLGE